MCFSRLLMLAVLLSVVTLAMPAAAQTPGCENLTEKQKALVGELFTALHPYDGCDGTFTECLAEKTIKPVVRRLASDICRQVKAGKSRQEVERALMKRAQTRMPMGKPAVFTLDPSMGVGAEEAPITVVVFACARCPFCKVIVPALYQAVTEGVLKGKARIYFKPFPIKDHPGSLEGGLALVAAAKLARFWPFTLDLYKRFDSFCPKVLPEWAVEAGMDRSAFQSEFDDPKSREALVNSKREGLRYGVKATPTLFINGHEYVYEMVVVAILDVLEEICEDLEKAKR